MTRPSEYSFQRYLAAKRSIDDRALNRHVWERLRDEVGGRRPLAVLEIGGGIGTMVERLVEWNLDDARADAPADLAVTMIDARPENIAVARGRLARWASSRGFSVEQAGGDLCVSGGDLSLRLTLLAEDLTTFAARTRPTPGFDIVLAHAVLDLLPMPGSAGAILGLARPGGLLYATVTFDGVTALEPAIDRALDAQIEALYHRTMDERVTGGVPSGDSRAGRHLFHRLTAAGAEVLAMGGSDWAVFPGQDGYPADEAYFLHFIVDTIDIALRGHPQLDGQRFAAWVDERHAQIERRELVYIAHQLDVLARTPSAGAQPSGDGSGAS